MSGWLANVGGSLLFAAFLASCIPSTQAIIEDGRAKVAASHERVEEAFEALRAQWDREADDVFARANAALIFPICNEQVPKGSQCGMVWDSYSDSGFQKAFAERNCATIPEHAGADPCVDMLVQAFVQDLLTRYNVEPREACARGGCESLALIELSTLRAHNEKVSEERRRALDVLEAKYTAKSEAILTEFRSEVERVEQETASKVRDAERRRVAVLAVSSAMKAYGDTLASRPSYNPSVTAGAFEGTSSPSGCSSDFDCGYGNICAKDSGALRGVCAKAVNEFGTPSLEPPRTDSVGPGIGQCMFDTECPVGFQCVKTSGGLRGNCMK